MESMNLPLESSNTILAIIGSVGILLLVTVAILLSVRKGTISARGAAAAILALGAAVIILLAVVLFIHLQLLAYDLPEDPQTARVAKERAPLFRSTQPLLLGPHKCAYARKS